MIRSSAATHPGARRRSNEDAVVDRAGIGLWAVADGAGGHGLGGEASAAVADCLAAIPPGLAARELQAQVRQRLGGVNALLRRRAAMREPPAPIASTVLVLMIREGYFSALWAGDSRLYRWRAGQLVALTRDHSVVAALVAAGRLSAEEATSHPHSHVITRAVGAEDTLDLERVGGPVWPGDVFLLCSDGLLRDLDEARIARLITAGTEAEGLVRAAVAADCRDNVSAVLVRCDAPDEAAAGA